jgi:hypothetical protein
VSFLPVLQNKLNQKKLNICKHLMEHYQIIVSLVEDLK